MCRLSRLSNFFNTIFQLAFLTNMVQHDLVSRAASRRLASSSEVGASGCVLRMFEILPSDGVCVSESARNCMAIFMDMLGSYSRSGAHDVCRWYQDYRNANTDDSARKQLLIPDVVAHVAWASSIVKLLG